MKYLLILFAFPAVACSTAGAPAPDCNAAQTTYNAYCNQQVGWLARIQSAKDAHNWTALDRYQDSLYAVQMRAKSYADSSGCNLILCN